jgi:transposase-like protein
MDMQATIARRIFAPDKKLEMGKFAHESTLGRQACARHLGVTPSQLDYYVRAYRFANGLLQPRNPPLTSDIKALAILAKLDGTPAKRGPYKTAKSAPTPTPTPTQAQLVPVDNQAGALANLRAANAALQADLDRALDEVLTLQKLLMVVGRTL